MTPAAKAYLKSRGWTILRMPMLKLSTLGPISIEIGDKRVPAANQQAHSALFYFIVERGKRVSRKALKELFFPGAGEEAAHHSLRQLVYRLRKIGAPIEGDASSLLLAVSAAAWDVEELLLKGMATDNHLAALSRGYLADFNPEHSPLFSRWLDEHRGVVCSKLRHVLLTQLHTERLNRRYDRAEQIARACLALDPLNEEATLVAAESLAMSGAKADAIALLDQYLEEVGPREHNLRLAPRVLRERISDYVVDSASTDHALLIGRETELAVLERMFRESISGSWRACLVTGPSGIGKTRLLTEACGVAALSGHAVVRVRLHSHDQQRPFAVLRELGPALLDLPGALGASPEALSTVRGLCGQGPSVFQSVPEGAFERQSVLAAIHTRVIELIDAISAEQPIILYVEDAHWTDAASLDLLSDILDDKRAVCILMASQRSLELNERVLTSLAFTSFALPPLSVERSTEVLSSLFRQRGRSIDDDFIRLAVRLSGGVPFYLHALFHHFLLTGDFKAIPSALADSLTARLDELSDNAKCVLDATVVLGPHCSEARLERVTQLPRYSLIQALRSLDEAGLIQITETGVSSAHDLFAAAARSRMPVTVARLLHRTSATLLEEATSSGVEPLAIAAHWEACGEGERALSVLRLSADRFVRLGRPREAIALLTRAHKGGIDENNQRAVEVSLFWALHSAGDYGEANALAERIQLFSGSAGAELQVASIANLYASGGIISHFLPLLVEKAHDPSLAGRSRGQAARLLEIIAEDTSNEPLAKLAFEAVKDLPDRLDSLLPRMIYETVFGSHETGAALATELFKTTIHQSPSAPRYETLKDACFALWRCGESTTAVTSLEHAYSLAKGAKVWGPCISFAGMLAEMHWYAGNLKEAREWTQNAEAHVRRSSSGIGAAQALSVKIMLALESGDPDAAQGFLDEAARVCPRVMLNRFAAEHVAYSTRILLTRGAALTDDQVDRLVSQHVAHRASGLQDVVADTTIEALRRTGRLAEANRLLYEYVHQHRQDRFPPPSHLRNLR